MGTCSSVDEEERVKYFQVFYFLFLKTRSGHMGSTRFCFDGSV